MGIEMESTIVSLYSGVACNYFFPWFAWLAMQLGLRGIIKKSRSITFYEKLKYHRLS